MRQRKVLPEAEIPQGEVDLV
ncbi:MAG: hypothetical protein RLZZ427_1459, partial [Pseudomonadota bacterium]